MKGPPSSIGGPQFFINVPFSRVVPVTTDYRTVAALFYVGDSVPL